MIYKNLIIIGTSHIAKQSLDEVKRTIEEEKPDIIALELDEQRLYSLMSRKKPKASIYNIGRIGFKGFIFSLIGAWAEKKLGEIVGVSPGDEMKTAVRLARKNKIRIALIDQNIEVTLKRFSKALSWREKWNFIADLFKAFILRKKEIEFDLSTVPDEKIIKKMINHVKKRYPNIYRVLIEERNIIMADNLSKLMDLNKDKKIVAIIGAGHEKEMVEMIKKQRVSYSFSVS
ncbi:TraB/GumN family protein [Candidatus Woesearchaeota archaeon]|nr:TraB/GumN family protein [Candidatus Woesearchaeota archaeon]